MIDKRGHICVRYICQCVNGVMKTNKQTRTQSERHSGLAMRSGWSFECQNTQTTGQDKRKKRHKDDVKSTFISI